MNRTALQQDLKAAQKRVKRCERERDAAQNELAGLFAEKTDGNLLAGIADGDGGKACGLILTNSAIRMAELTLADAEKALELALAEVARLEAEMARCADRATADRLECFGAELQLAAEGIDQAIVSLVEACSHHRDVLEAIGKLCPDIMRGLLDPHQRRLPMRCAMHFHALSPKFVPTEGIARSWAAPFASVRPGACP